MPAAFPSNKILRWAPRLLAIALALFLSLFAFDVFDGSAGFWQTLAAFLIHLAPTWAILIALLLAWFRPGLGGVVFVALAVFFLLKFGTDMLFLWLVAGLLAFIGTLFIVQGWMNRPRQIG